MVALLMADGESASSFSHPPMLCIACCCAQDSTSEPIHHGFTKEQVAPYLPWVMLIMRTCYPSPQSCEGFWDLFAAKYGTK